MNFFFFQKIYSSVAAALVFDVSRMATFQSVKKWLADLREKAILPDGSKIPVVLLANKCDIHQSAVTNDQIVKFCKEYDIGAWFVTSAKENTNIGIIIFFVNFFYLKNKRDKVFFFFCIDEAMHFLVNGILKTVGDEPFRESIQLKDNYFLRNKTYCCKSR